MVLVGHGWGPGIGMGQWGDFGYAVRYHLGYQAILAHFYGKTSLSSLGSLAEAADPTITVAILENLNLKSNVGYDPVVTSTGAFSVIPGSSGPTATSTSVPAPTGASGPASTGSSGATASGVSGTGPTGESGIGPTGESGANGAGASFAAGTALDLHLQANGTWNAYEASSCTGARQAELAAAPVLSGLVNPVVAPLAASSTTTAGLLTLCRHDGVDEPLRGDVEAFDRSGYERTLNVVSLQDYLQGVVPAEESASWGLDGGTAGAPQGEPWGFQALEAQAVAARSYVLANAANGGWNGYADICDTDDCQAYVGATYETPASDAAVADTIGLVLTESDAPASVVLARFSASTGGWTAPSAFPAVPDLGDACVDPDSALECNPNHTWQQTVSGAAISRAYRSVGTLQRVRVIERNRRGALGGRALEVLIAGTKGRIKVSGDAFASALDLRSDWFAVAKLTTRPTTVSSEPTTTLPPSAPSGPSGDVPTGPLGSSGASVSGPSGQVAPSGSSGASGA